MQLKISIFSLAAIFALAAARPSIAAEDLCALVPNNYQYFGRRANGGGIFDKDKFQLATIASNYTVKLNTMCSNFYDGSNLDVMSLKGLIDKPIGTSCYCSSDLNNEWIIVNRLPNCNDDDVCPRKCYDRLQESLGARKIIIRDAARLQKISGVTDECLTKTFCTEPEGGIVKYTNKDGKIYRTN
jgi:hypothetical protein